MVEYRFEQRKNKWAARIFEKWGKARFPKEATLEPGGLSQLQLSAIHLLSI